MKKNGPSEMRDDLDQKIARHVRSARTPHGVPAPGRHEPSDDELLRVIDGVASAAERKKVDEAAKKSAYTRDRLEATREGLAESGHAAGAAVQAARYVFVLAKDAIEFLRGATEPLAAPQLAWATRKGSAAKTAESFFELRHAFPAELGGIEARLKIEQVGGAPGAAKLDLEVTLASAGAKAGTTRVTLVREGKTVESVPVEGTGSATFRALPLARYEVRFARAGKPAGQVTLDFLK